MKKKNRFIKKKFQFRKLKTKKRLKLRNKQPRRIQKYGIIRIKCCTNNTIVTITKRNGKAQKTFSCGSIGFKKAQKTKAPAMMKLIKYTVGYAKYFKLKRVICVITNRHNGLRKLLKGIKKQVKIIRIIFNLNIPHNGCRIKKKRRK